jgi:serine/threonine-protein kinase
MGEVYAAFDERLEREVALKVLSEEGNLVTQKKRLMREAKLAAKLTHPNIATIYEVDEIGDRLYIVMELLDGWSLRRVLTQRKMEIDEAISVARDVARALARAHAGGVIHRDVKPENVFLTKPSPDALLAKVLDFGLARQRPDINVAEATYTATRGDLWGTPGYVSPEQAHGQQVDVRTDIFSFGVILYEMLAGIKPFRGENPLAVMIATTRTEPRPLREIRSEVPQAIEEIVARCLRKNRDERFPDGAALSGVLEAFIRGNPSPYAMSSVIGANPGGPILSLEDVGGNMVASQALSAGRRALPTAAPAAPGPAATSLFPGFAGLDLARAEHMKLVAAIGGGVALALIMVVVILAVLTPTPRARVTGVAAAATAQPSETDASIIDPADLPLTVTPAASVPVDPDAPPEPAPSASGAAAPGGSSPSAAPSGSSAVHPGASGGPTGHGSHKKPADCVDPFRTDAKGVRIPKLYCL